MHILTTAENKIDVRREIAELKAVETAEPQTMKIEEILAELDERKNIRYISRNSIRRELAEFTKK